jgi:hypothetical protein
MNFLKAFPEKEILLKDYGYRNIFDLNGHVHSPYSFSAFHSIPHIFELAKRDNIRAVGINDFVVVDGYTEFHDSALMNHVFPFFNIEFMGLLKSQQASGVRINDPQNPGRTYFSGKGLDYPSRANNNALNILEKLKRENNVPTSQMTAKVDKLLKKLNAPFSLTFNEVRDRLSMGMVRERHIAKAIRIKIFQHYENQQARQRFLQKLCGSDKPIDFTDDAALESDIRSRLLKKGGTAFVEENDKSFLELEKLIDIILNLGGIPCYPVLLDDGKGEFTEFEKDFEKLGEMLRAKNVFMVELIPKRNDFKILKRFVRYFNEIDFVITFGTEHNTPELLPLRVACRGGVVLDEFLRKINYEGACIIAAHQYLRARNIEGFCDIEGKAKIDQKKEFIHLGEAVFNYFFQSGKF